MNIKKLLGKRLQEIRKSKKFTQEQMAELVGVETSSISNIENGKYYPSADNLDKILEALNVKPSDIFMFEHNAPKEELISEMTKSMYEDEKLTKLLYKFYKAVNF